MPIGASPKREREYKKLEQKFEHSGRYGKRAKEVAARIVNKQRSEAGETKSAKSKSSSGKVSSRKTSLRVKKQSRRGR